MGKGVVIKSVRIMKAKDQQFHEDHIPYSHITTKSSKPTTLIEHEIKTKHNFKIHMKKIDQDPLVQGPKGCKHLAMGAYN